MGAVGSRSEGPRARTDATCCVGGWIYRIVRGPIPRHYKGVRRVGRACAVAYGGPSPPHTLRQPAHLRLTYPECRRVTDGARTRDLRSHKWVVGTQGAQWVRSSGTGSFRTRSGWGRRARGGSSASSSQTPSAHRWTTPTSYPATSNRSQGERAADHTLLRPKAFVNNALAHKGCVPEDCG